LRKRIEEPWKEKTASKAEVAVAYFKWGGEGGNVAGEGDNTK